MLLNLNVEIMKKTTTLLAILILAVSQSAFSQSVIFGSVVDAETGAIIITTKKK
jgi:hypothetical protein